MDSLRAPWRMDYIRSLDAPDPRQCFICEAANTIDNEQRRKRLVLWTTDHCVVLINLFPYTNGHLLIAPRQHLADLEELSVPVTTDLQVQTTEAVKLLKRAISPQGFNIGI